jgi:hypothetical protein
MSAFKAIEIDWMIKVVKLSPGMLIIIIDELTFR